MHINISKKNQKQLAVVEVEKILKTISNEDVEVF